MTVTYEWDVETIDRATSEIVNHQHADRLRDLSGVAAEPGTRLDLVLVRDCGRDGRSWAYVRGGSLPQEFTRPDSSGVYVRTGVRVPKRFHEELGRGFVWFEVGGTA